MVVRRDVSLFRLPTLYDVFSKYVLPPVKLYLGQIIYEHIPQISATLDALGEVSFTGQIPQVTLLQVAVLLIVK